MKFCTQLPNFSYENYGVRTNLGRLFSKSSKLMILAVDQGFEHGPDRAFNGNPEAFNPDYHFDMASSFGFSAYAAPIGQIQASIDKFFGKVPLILKLNSGNSLSPLAPNQNITATVDDALTLGCIGVGMTLYPGSSLNPINDFKEIAKEARSKGLFVVAWSYPRGENLSKEDETSLDVISYGAHMACLLGAHIVKVKLPTHHLKWNYAPLLLELKDRVSHVVKCCFEGKRIVIFSGGESKTKEDLINEVIAIKQGGGSGSIIGRNIFQRDRKESEKLINEIKKIYEI